MALLDQLKDWLASCCDSAFIGQALCHDAIEWRRDGGKVDLDAERIGLRLGGLDTGQRGVRLRFGLIDTLLRDMALQFQLALALHGAERQVMCRAGFLDLRIRRGELRL